MGRESVGRFDGPFEFRVLGPTEVLRKGEPLRVRGSRERDLLTLLVVQANRIVTTEQLVEDLWAGTVPHGRSGRCGSTSPGSAKPWPVRMIWS